VLFKKGDMTGVWRKTLYERSGLPDNYTPAASFLAAIQRNKDLRLYSRRECLQGAAIVGRELSLVITFWSLYLYLRYLDTLLNHLLGPRPRCTFAFVNLRLV
jgi:hypothetical protein